jgi:hypothetical protein
MYFSIWLCEVVSMQTVVLDANFSCSHYCHFMFTLPHLPYSPDLTPSDYHMFGPLKEAMGGKKFRSVEEVYQAVHEWLRIRPQEFFSRGIRALRVRWRKCVERQGDLC